MVIEDVCRLSKKLRSLFSIPSLGLSQNNKISDSDIQIFERMYSQKAKLTNRGTENPIFLNHIFRGMVTHMALIISDSYMPYKNSERKNIKISKYIVQNLKEKSNIPTNFLNELQNALIAIAKDQGYTPKTNAGIYRVGARQLPKAPKFLLN